MRVRETSGIPVGSGEMREGAQRIYMRFILKPSEKEKRAARARFQHLVFSRSYL